MFDDLNQKTNKIEDIFSKTEKGEKGEKIEAVVLQKPAPVPPAPPIAEIREEGGERGKEKVKKILIFAILIIAVVLIIFGIFWLLKKIDATLNKGTGEQKQEESLKEEEIPNISGENQVSEAAPTAAELPSPSESIFFPPSVTEPIDSDQDGLSDEEEGALGTDINNTDTDSDGLFDREEVKVYRTNPLAPDTDGDGYSDGDEVKNGYNPAGPGRLYEIN